MACSSVKDWADCLRVGGVGRAFHVARRNPRQAAQMLPRKDTDVMILDEGKEYVILDNVDTFRRHSYYGNWDLLKPRQMEKGFPYWRSTHCILDVTLPNINDLQLEPGLHIPDEVFLMRMLARWRMVEVLFRLRNERLPSHLENADPLFHSGLIRAKMRRATKGDPDNTLNMDQVQIRPLTGFEKHCLGKILPSARPSEFS